MRLVAEVEQALDVDYVRMVRRYMLAHGGGCRFFTDKQILRLREVCPDADLLAIALRMKPPPAWVQEVLG